jgi:hypothetical protein
MAALLLTGCAPAPAANSQPYCPVPAALRTAHAAALIEDGGPKSQRTGATLIAAVDALTDNQQP